MGTMNGHDAPPWMRKQGGIAGAPGAPAVMSPNSHVGDSAIQENADSGKPSTTASTALSGKAAGADAAVEGSVPRLLAVDDHHTPTKNSARPAPIKVPAPMKAPLPHSAPLFGGQGAIPSDAAGSRGRSSSANGNAQGMQNRPSGSRRESGSSVRSEDPEDWWEDEDSDPDELGVRMQRSASSNSARDDEEQARREQAASYKAAMREYRASKKALMRSRNLSLFASTGSEPQNLLPPSPLAREARQLRSPFEIVQDEADTLVLDGPIGGLGLLSGQQDSGHGSPRRRSTSETTQPKSPLLSSPELPAALEGAALAVPDKLAQLSPQTPVAALPSANGTVSSKGKLSSQPSFAVPASAPPGASDHTLRHRQSNSSNHRPSVHHRRSSSLVRDARPPLLQQPSSRSGHSGPSSAQLAPSPSKDALSQPLPSPSKEEEHLVGPFSLWDYLREEVLATDFDSTQELKWERVTNFISIPFWMEKIIAFGFVVCLDSFLYTFTIMPLRFGVALWQSCANALRWLLGGEKRYLSSSHKCDILKAVLFVMACYILSRVTDASKMYHSVRGQDLVKLYVIFNVLEIADRLCCSFGQDILDTLFSRTTLARRRDGRQPYLRPLAFFTLSLAYVIGHTLVLFYQMVTLNVAINSYDNALLSLLLSNQFVEIKGSVFKKFEKENLFQMTCADIVERFQLSLMLTFIAVRNLIELAGAQSEGGAGPLPTSFTVLPSFNLLETIFTPVCIVIASECFVDWLKHAFITKFNHIRPAVYGRFMDVLCRDLVITSPGQKSKTYRHTFVDQSPIVSRRLGFAALPLACLLVRVGFQIMSMVSDTSHFDECAVPEAHRHRFSSKLARSTAFGLGAMDESGAVHRSLQFIALGLGWILTVFVAWTFLVGIKILLGVKLVAYASKRYATMHERELEEKLNARDRAPIGVGSEEMAYDAKLAQFLDKNDDNASKAGFLGAEGSSARGRPADGKAGNKHTSLLDVSRYTMVRSRLW